MSSHSDSYGQRQAIAANAAIRKISLGCRSMPTSPRMMPKQAHFYRPPASPIHSSNGSDAGACDQQTMAQKSNGHSKDSKIMALLNGSGVSNSGWHFSALTDQLNVQQVNNYSNQSAIPEINWQERCLELQLELHRSKNQSERIRGMLRDKVGGKCFPNEFFIHIHTLSLLSFILSFAPVYALIGISHFGVEYI